MHPKVSHPALIEIGQLKSLPHATAYHKVEHETFAFVHAPRTAFTWRPLKRASRFRELPRELCIMTLIPAQ